ncbi:hypothetical protein EYF80_003930 [Liparis tanakae]|uniref:Uncharacterized protein n=1 Tax=Liparis tanakae TaxID=230148 RepID=A0A4Z2J7T4_9TELE|nr:hypothetical protein EYF80_003930 [Liparis tanakae]
MMQCSQKQDDHNTISPTSDKVDKLGSRVFSERVVTETDTHAVCLSASSRLRQQATGDGPSTPQRRYDTGTTCGLLNRLGVTYTYGHPLCLCVTLHPLEGGQVAATAGPGGPCQPHTVQQLTREKENERERGWEE